MVGFLFGKCDSCAAIICDEIDVEDPEHVTCKGCGAKLKPSTVPGTKLTGKISRSGTSKKKGLLAEIRIAFQPLRNRNGVLVRYERLIDHHEDRYVERVTLYDSGEVIHLCDEPLTKHQGHGSAKRKPAS